MTLRKSAVKWHVGNHPQEVRGESPVYSRQRDKQSQRPCRGARVSGLRVPKAERRRGAKTKEGATQRRNWTKWPTEGPDGHCGHGTPL